jgi:hypothetical protein
MDKLPPLGLLLNTAKFVPADVGLELMWVQQYFFLNDPHVFDHLLGDDKLSKLLSVEVALAAFVN